MVYQERAELKFWYIRGQKVSSTKYFKVAKFERKLTLIPILKIHPSQLITYNETHWYPSRPPHKEKDKETTTLIQVEVNGKIELKRVSTKFLYSTRQGNGKLSKQAKKRLELAIEYFLLLNKPQNGKSGNSGQHYQKQITFTTLTLPSKQIHSDTEIKSKCLNQLLIELSRYHKVEQYVWRAEKQKNGNIHFHMLADRYIIWQDIRNRWNRIINKLGYIDRYKIEQEKFHKAGFQVRQELIQTWPAEAQKKAYERGKRLNWNDPNSTDIHSIYGITNIKNYLTKYLTKGEKTSEEHSKKSTEIPVNIGRGWAASTILSNIKGASSQIDSKLQEHLKNIERTFPEKVYKAVYFTIIDITLEDIHSLHCRELEIIFAEYLSRQFNYYSQLII